MFGTGDTDYRRPVIRISNNLTDDRELENIFICHYCTSGLRGMDMTATNGIYLNIVESLKMFAAVLAALFIHRVASQSYRALDSCKSVTKSRTNSHVAHLTLLSTTDTWGQ